MSVLSGAVETAPVSDLHAQGSVDPADFAVPGGREEEWRFTPLRRLRGLHKDAPLTQSGVMVTRTMEETIWPRFATQALPPSAPKYRSQAAAYSGTIPFTGSRRAVPRTRSTL